MSGKPKPRRNGGKPALQKPRETPPEMIASYAAMFVAFLFIVTFGLQAFAIPSGSMENTLLIGDHLFVNRLTLAPRTSWMPLLPYREIRRGDIIVFNKPGENLILVKRVIGIPGDRLHLRDGVVYVNGQEQKEPYAIHRAGDDNPYRDDFPAAPASDFDPLTERWRSQLPQHIEGGDLAIPPGFYFAMGDNRDNSLDSRYWGFVPRENVLGTPLFIYWSFPTPADEYLRSTSDKIAFTAHEVLHFFDQTRWKRMFRAVR